MCHKRNLVPRRQLFDAYWRFAAQRQAIFFRRFNREPAPWTEDPILRSFKFCNVYRASDRVTQFLIRDVIYQNGYSAGDTLLRIILFRLFSKPSTWRLMESTHGPIRCASFDPEAIARTLDAALDRDEAIYTNAFILAPGSAFGHRRKHQNHVSLVETMMRNGLARDVARASSLEALYRLLIDYPMIGPFMAYQLAIDINYSELTDFSENDFTMPGPGARRGIAKCFADAGSRSEQEIIHWMVERQEAEFERLGLEFQTLWGRRLHAIDCQNLFCEVDKYARIAFPDLKSDRVRIKTKFTPSQESLDLFYPPEWGINDSIPT